MLWYSIYSHLKKGIDIDIMGKIKNAMMRFMQGRYGMDHLSRALAYVSLAMLIITLFWHNSFVYIIAVALMFYTYFRVFSRNISKRYSENQAYLRFKYKIFGKFNTSKARFKDSKTHKIFKCPACSQKIRVPRGKGRISIKCPKCRIEFIKKT